MEWLRKSLETFGTGYWKHDFLMLMTLIDTVLAVRLNAQHGAVQQLLAHHLKSARDLLGADVNGGLDEFYEEELAELNDKMSRLRSASKQD